jgi:sugar-phosphatase
MLQNVYLGSEVVIIVVAGPAGSGKSTLGIQLARSLRLPCLDLDTMTNPVLEGIAASLQMHWNDARLRDVVRPARYRALRNTLADQVAAGMGAVVVAPFTAELRGGPEWDELVAAAAGAPFVVWVHAAPELLAERRAARGADRDAHIVDGSADTVPAVAHLRVDAALPTAQQLDQVLREPSIGRRD